MATKTNRITSPDRDLEQFVIDDVQLTGVTLGAGAYGSVEEVEIPGARVAAKKLHFHIVNLGSPQKVSSLTQIIDMLIWIAMLSLLLHAC